MLKAQIKTRRNEMINGEMFKSAEERGRAFNEYCNKQQCRECELRNFHGRKETNCAFQWLDLEYEEELKPCPFCGNESVRVYKHVGMDDWYVSCAGCGIRTEGNTSKDIVVAAWNRRVK